MISHHLLQCAGCSEGADSILAYVAPIGWIVTGRSGVEVPELFCVAVCDRVASERICLRVLVRRAVGFQLGDLKGRGCGVMSRASRTVFVCAAGWGAMVVLCCVVLCWGTMESVVGETRWRSAICCLAKPHVIASISDFFSITEIDI